MAARRYNQVESPCAALLTAARAARACAAAHHNTSRWNSLPCLPAELLLMIRSHLSLKDASILMIACSRFWKSRKQGIFAPVWHQLHPPPGANQQNAHHARLLRFYTLRMLEYDGKLEEGEHCCSGCVAIHRRTAFSREELDKKVDLKADYVSRVEQDLCRAATNARFCLATRVSIRFGFAHTMTFLDLRNEVSPWAWCQCGGRFCVWCPVDYKENVRGTIRCWFYSTRVGRWIPIAKQDISSFGNLCPLFTVHQLCPLPSHLPCCSGCDRAFWQETVVEEKPLAVRRQSAANTARQRFSCTLDRRSTLSVTWAVSGSPLIRRGWGTRSRVRTEIFCLTAQCLRSGCRTLMTLIMSSAYVCLSRTFRGRTLQRSLGPSRR